MVGKLDGKVALITGAARGQGRSLAIRFAEEGADIVAVDICGQIDTVPFAMGNAEDLAETVNAVESLDRRIVAREADVRDFESLSQAVAEGVRELGRLDIIVANAGIVSFGQTVDLEREQWQDVLDVNITGVWHTIKAGVPHIRSGGEGGAIVLTSSICGFIGMQNVGHYDVAKHGVVGLMRVLANELGSESIRVNTVNPTVVDTLIFHNEPTYKLFAPDSDTTPTRDDIAPAAAAINILPIPWIEPRDVSNAVLFLVSDEARYITGVALPVDAGALAKS